MLERAFHLASRVLAVIAGTALLVMMVLTFFDVIGRYGFNKSIFGTAEMVEYLMIFTIFAGLAFVTATNDHITVTMFDGWIEVWIPNLRRWAVVVFSIACYALMTIYLAVQGYEHWIGNKRSPVLDLPIWIMPAAGAALSIVGLALIVTAAIKTSGWLNRVAYDLSSFDASGKRPDADIS